MTKRKCGTFAKHGVFGASGAKPDRVGLGGALPVNPDGGGLSSNHPGMRGIFLVIEAVRQLRGRWVRLQRTSVVM